MMVLFPVLALLFKPTVTFKILILISTLSRRAKLGVSCRVKVPVGMGISNDFL